MTTDIQSAAHVECLDAGGNVICRVDAAADLDSLRMHITADEARRCKTMRLIGRDGLILAELPSRSAYVAAALERDVAAYLAGGTPVDADEFIQYIRQRIKVLPGIAEAESGDVQDGCEDGSQFYCWVRLTDGSGAVAEFDLNANPGCRVSVGFA